MKKKAPASVTTTTTATYIENRGGQRQKGVVNGVFGECRGATPAHEHDNENHAEVQTETESERKRFDTTECTATTRKNMLQQNNQAPVEHLRPIYNKHTTQHREREALLVRSDDVHDAL